MKRRDFLKGGAALIAGLMTGGVATAEPAAKLGPPIRKGPPVRTRPSQPREIVGPFDVAGSIDWLLEHASDARWDIMSRAMQTLENDFVKKTNDDAWYSLMGATKFSDSRLTNSQTVLK